MERKIGEKFKYNEHILTIIESKTCEGCFFFDVYCRANRVHVNNIVGWCFDRNDCKDVIFKEV